MTPSLVLIGGGGHARVVAEAARLSDWLVLGCIVPHPEPGLTALGCDDDLPAVLAEHDALAILAVGPISLRRSLAARHAGVTWARVVHPSAAIAADVALAPGAFVGPQAVANPGSRIGAHAIINSGAIVEHDCVIGDFAHLAPGSVLGGRVVVGEGVFIGLGARVRDGVTIGAGATIGMGAVVVGDVAPGATVVGIPARARP